MSSYKSSLVNMIATALLLASCSTPVLQENPTTTIMTTNPTAASNEMSTKSVNSPTEKAPQPAESPVSTPEVASPPLSNVPLKDALDGLEPQDVFRNFYAITQVPRPSGYPDQIRAFLIDFGQGLGLETLSDEAGNVLIRKPASVGFENRQGVILQSHMDMVTQKADGKKFEPKTDPIEAYVNGDEIVTDGTTLGADNGIGMAMAMAVLQSKTIQTGPLEALFTVNEETSMSGAKGLKAGWLQESILINLDSEWEGTFIISSAGGAVATIQATFPEAPLPVGAVAYQLRVQGLKGGHSGIDINLGRGNAAKLLARLLRETSTNYGVRVAQIASGSAYNAIPRDATALIVLPKLQENAFLKAVRDYEKTIQVELAATEPDLTVRAEPTVLPERVMEEIAQRKLIGALVASPQGVLRMSDVVPGLVETSTNLGVLTSQNGDLQVKFLLRSSVDSALEDAIGMVSSVWELVGMPVTISDRYAGWPANPRSPILGLMQQVYQDMYGQAPTLMAIHAGLECGTIAAKYPGLDAISIGPTMDEVHSPTEKLDIPSVKKAMAFLVEVLKNIPEV